MRMTISGLLRLAFALPVLVTAACGDKSALSPFPFPLAGGNEYTAFSNPEPVVIAGYGGDAMEPFISRDGAFLFFNDTLNNKDLYYASRIDDTTYQFPLPISDINSPAVDGVPTTDDAGNFYFVSLYNYDGASKLDSLYKGAWDNGAKTVAGRTPLGVTFGSPFLYFDIEASPDGATLYLSLGFFNGGDFPAAADIVIATDPGGGYTLDPNSPAVMVNVNTADKLEYAPAISRNGLELFFTRFDPQTGTPRIYRTVRSDIAAAFGAPQAVSAVTGFVEGPALSPDEKSLYYHRLNTVANRFEIYRVTRP